MSEVLKKIALPLVVLGFYPLVKLLSETTVNLPTYGRNIDVSLKTEIWGSEEKMFVVSGILE